MKAPIADIAAMVTFPIVASTAGVGVAVVDVIWDSKIIAVVGPANGSLISGLDETTFCETETRPRPGLIEISRPRRDRDFYKMIFRDRDETETRNLDREMREIENETRISWWISRNFTLKTRDSRREFFISLFSRPRQDRDFCKMIFRDRDEKFGPRNTRNRDRDESLV